jgi:hypothetical protein
MALTPEDLAGMRYQAQAPKTNKPYDPRSGNTPDAKPLDLAGMRYQAQAPKPQTPFDPMSMKAPDYQAPTEPGTTFLPVAIIITQSGEEIAVDASGRAEDGSVPVGSTKPVPTGGGGAGAGAGADAGGGVNQDNSKRQSAYDLLFEQFSKYGLGSLVEPLKNLITDPGVNDSEFTIRLRETPAYQKRFAANAERVKKGLTALDEGDYLALEDQYQEVMRNYGLPASYYTKGDLGRQEGFEKLIANDVSNVELEKRIMTAQDRVLKSNPQVLNTLKAFYPDITNGDILAYTLDPTNALKDIQRKVTAAEIGGAATAAGLSLGKTPAEIAASEARAQMLAGYGVTKEAAMSGFQTVAETAPRGGQLAEFYNRPTYGQMEAEQEVFNLEGAVAARKKRKELVGLEQAAFGAKSGLAQGALERNRAGTQ